MGYDQHQRSSSTGAVIAVVVVVLLLAVLGLVAVVGAGLFFVRTERIAVEKARRAEVMARQQAAIAAVEAKRSVAIAETQQESSASVTQTESANLVVRLDRRGAAIIDEQEVDLDVLRARLTKWKQETNARLSLQINADSECPVKHVVAVLDICEEVGDIDCRIASSPVTNVAAEQSNAED